MIQSHPLPRRTIPSTNHHSISFESYYTAPSGLPPLLFSPLYPFLSIHAPKVLHGAGGLIVASAAYIAARLLGRLGAADIIDAEEEARGLQTRLG